MISYLFCAVTGFAEVYSFYIMTLCRLTILRIGHTHIHTSELIAADRLAKREILKLEEDLPQWQTVLDTGSGPG